MKVPKGPSVQRVPQDPTADRPARPRIARPEFPEAANNHPDESEYVGQNTPAWRWTGVAAIRAVNMRLEWAEKWGESARSVAVELVCGNVLRVAFWGLW